MGGSDNVRGNKGLVNRMSERQISRVLAAQKLPAEANAKLGGGGVSQGEMFGRFPGAT